jgi:hypothetical protein
MEGYIFGLFREGELIDQTSLDEDSLPLAESLFFGEFGHHKSIQHKVELMRVDEDEN